MASKKHHAVSHLDLEVPRGLYGRNAGGVDQHDVHFVFRLKISDGASREKRPPGDREAHGRIRYTLDLEGLGDINTDRGTREGGCRQIG